MDKYFIVSCLNLHRRIDEHNIGHSKFTSPGLPWELKYFEDYKTIHEARQRELQIKRMKSQKYIEGLIAKGSASRY